MIGTVCETTKEDKQLSYELDAVHEHSKNQAKHMV